MKLPSHSESDRYGLHVRLVREEDVNKFRNERMSEIMNKGRSEGMNEKKTRLVINKKSLQEMS